MASSPDPRRRQQLAAIHAGKKQLALEEDTYRDLLQRVTGLRSAANLSEGQRLDVLREMRRLGMPEAKRSWPGEPAAEHMQKRPMLGKVRALLADAKRPWAYAHATAEQMYQITRVEWLNDDQLHALVSALQIDANRRQSSATPRSKPRSKPTTRKPPSC